jgi:hypothetical protein
MNRIYNAIAEILILLKIEKTFTKNEEFRRNNQDLKTN